MEKLIQGIHRFQSDVFAVNRDFFDRLVDGQRPQALFITCSDSRIVPDLICQTDPGDLFVMRNAGNIIPPYSSGSSAAEAATIEYAIKGLGIKNLIVCGHTLCGAMQAVLHPETTVDMPRVRHWLGNTDACAEIVANCYPDLEPEARWKVLVQENVLTQLENVRTHPCVATGLATGELKLHAWVYKMETGQVYAFDPETGQYAELSASTRSLDSEEPPTLLTARRSRSRAPLPSPVV